VKAANIRVRRVYEPPSADDGLRVLVDRIWPRGLRKDGARLDEWARDIAPSAKLRTWYGHDPAKLAEFRSRYVAALATPAAREALGRLRLALEQGPVTLLTATKDLSLSQATVLAELLSGAAAEKRRLVTEDQDKDDDRDAEQEGKGKSAR
jgi:uncharacterized protein YeaO (DUF488 family)